MSSFAARSRFVSLSALVLLLSLLPVLQGCGGNSSSPSTSTPTTTTPPNNSTQAAPVIASISPSTVQTGSPDFKLTVTGQNFLPSSIVQWNGVSLTSVTTSATEITATVTAANVASVGNNAVTVVDPSPLSLTSNSVNFAVTAPVPTITALTPSTAIVGSQTLIVTLAGRNYVSGSVVQFGTTPLATTVLSSTQIRSTIPATLLATTGSYNITVVNPAPNAATSVPFVFTVTPVPPPSITSLSPATVVEGAGGFTLTVNGQNFPAGSTVQWNGTTLSSNYLGTSTVMATVPDSLVATAGTYPITVVSPGSGSGSIVSAAANFSVTALPEGMMILGQTANDIVADPIHPVIYASVPSTATQNGNNVLAIDAASGTIIKKVQAGSEPNRMAVSDDGQFLYVALDGSSSVKRFSLPDLTEDFTVSLGSDAFFGANVALDLAVAPGSPHVWAVTSGNLGVSPAAQQGVSIYDDAVRRGPSVGRNSPHGGFDLLLGIITWGKDDSVLYGANNESTGFDLYVLPIGTGGIGTITDYSGAMPGFNNGHIRYEKSTGYVYGESGYIVNPATGNAAGRIAFNGSMVTDGNLKLAFFVGGAYGSVPSGTLASFDLSALTPVNTLLFPNVSGTPGRLIRWGANGIAFNTINYNYSGTTTTKTGKIYLYSGTFVKAN
ncbi:hypothetical protein JAO29_11885 [Edaphobacter sp. HDX4]|uniref:hypothetical protein n=1 Tax=Edaphobacter sp. HDX4 TaxID=2794064 RepID=UPI002FE558A0